MSSTNAERKNVESYFLSAGKMYDIHFNGEMHMGGIFLFPVEEGVASFEFGATSEKYGEKIDFPKEKSTFFEHVPTEKERENGAEEKPEQLKVPSAKEEPALIASAIKMLENLKLDTDYSFEFIDGTTVGKYLQYIDTTMFCQVPGSGRVSTPLSWLKSVKNVSA